MPQFRPTPQYVRNCLVALAWAILRGKGNAWGFITQDDDRSLRLQRRYGGVRLEGTTERWATA
jgi:hypothetical protein